ncbi:uncharacterized protein LOC118457131 [Anopheles albimanus]|uniref:Spaetzle domain-containing protein n=1 Tax=Anopheles albimanus TaxID=7167 RepID=A0A182FM68_ANOAL|nr:uncharacterized protein LOC118457131 [Anopheles albimanus]
MKLTPIVCGVLFGLLLLLLLLLVPADGRLQYGRRTDLGETDRNPANVTHAKVEELEEEELEEEEEEEEEEVEEQGLPPANCHHSSTPAHYGWTLQRLSQQLAAAAAAATAAEAAAKGTAGAGQEARRRERAPRKRTSVDYGRELSADLYAQYPSSCACQTKYELLDLGYTHFPRYIVNAICQNRSASSRKCWRGSSCKEIPYKVRVLTRRYDGAAGEHGTDTDHHSTLLPEPLRAYWRFRTVTIAAACQCSL